MSGNIGANPPSIAYAREIVRRLGRNVRRSCAGNSALGPAATSLNHAEYQRRELPVKRET
ncbi:hypothetical protein POU30_23095 [Escherichia coli]